MNADRPRLHFQESGRPPAWVRAWVLAAVLGAVLAAVLAGVVARILAVFDGASQLGKGPLRVLGRDRRL